MAQPISLPLNYDVQLFNTDVYGSNFNGDFIQNSKENSQFFSSGLDYQITNIDYLGNNGTFKGIQSIQDVYPTRICASLYPPLNLQYVDYTGSGNNQIFDYTQKTFGYNSGLSTQYLSADITGHYTVLDVDQTANNYSSYNSSVMQYADINSIGNCNQFYIKQNAQTW